jgi:hypothetical protein
MKKNFGLDEYAEKYGCGGMILLCIVLLALVFGIDCLIVWACMALWNGCLLGAIPIITSEVSFWQMFGIYYLFGFLFRAHPKFSNNDN